MRWPNVKESPPLAHSIVCAKGTSKHQETSRCCCAELDGETLGTAASKHLRCSRPGGSGL